MADFALLRERAAPSSPWRAALELIRDDVALSAETMRHIADDVLRAAPSEADGGISIDRGGSFTGGDRISCRWCGSFWSLRPRNDAELRDSIGRHMMEKHQ